MYEHEYNEFHKWLENQSERFQGLYQMYETLVDKYKRETRNSGLGEQTWQQYQTCLKAQKELPPLIDKVVMQIGEELNADKS